MYDKFQNVYQKINWYNCFFAHIEKHKLEHERLPLYWISLFWKERNKKMVTNIFTRMSEMHLINYLHPASKSCNDHQDKENKLVSTCGKCKVVLPFTTGMQLTTCFPGWIDRMQNVGFQRQKDPPNIPLTIWKEKQWHTIFLCSFILGCSYVKRFTL